MSTRRIVIAFVACALLAFSSPAALGAAPMSTPIAESAPLDLAAMVPTPDDLGAPGWLIDSGFSQTADERLNSLTAPIPAAFPIERPSLPIHGLRRIYTAISVLPVSATDTRAQRIVQVDLVEYQDSFGSTNALHERLGADVAANVTDLPDPSIGDESGMEAIAPAAANSSDDASLVIAFRRRNLMAAVVLSDLGKTPVDRTRGVALGTLVLDKMNRVSEHGGPGLSAMVLRLPAPDDLSKRGHDNYSKLAGKIFRWRDNTDANYALRTAQFAEATDAYQFFTPLGENGGFGGAALRFSSPDVAARFVQTSTIYEENTAPPGARVTAVTGAPTYGDQSVITELAISTPALSGYGIVVRIGSLVEAVSIGRNSGVTLADAELLGEAQADCLWDGFCPASSLVTAAGIANETASPASAGTATPGGG